MILSQKQNNWYLISASTLRVSWKSLFIISTLNVNGDMTFLRGEAHWKRIN